MRKVYLSGFILVSGISAYLVFLNRDESPDNHLTSHKNYEKFLNEHPFNQIPEIEFEENEDGEAETDQPEMAAMQNFLMTMDPAMKRPTPEVLEVQRQRTARIRDGERNRQPELATSLSTGTTWTERGPKSVGGRTRALMFDPNDATKKKVWAGGVAGGLWFNPDITNAASPWQKVDDFWDNMAVTCIAADPVNPQIFYVGTGEGWRNLDLVIGAGIWKTTNGGATWIKLPSTTGFSLVNDIIVRNESNVGVVYAAVSGGSHDGFSAINNGLQRSLNGGSTWTQVLPASISSKAPTDIEIAKDNKLFVGTE
jgi:hypothetical protein